MIIKKLYHGTERWWWLNCGLKELMRSFNIIVYTSAIEYRPILEPKKISGYWLLLGASALYLESILHKCQILSLHMYGRFITFSTETSPLATSSMVTCGYSHYYPDSVFDNVWTILPGLLFISSREHHGLFHHSNDLLPDSPELSWSIKRHLC